MNAGVSLEALAALLLDEMLAYLLRTADHLAPRSAGELP